MRNIKRKSISMLLIVALIITMAVPVFADDYDSVSFIDTSQLNVMVVGNDNYIVLDMSIFDIYLLLDLVEKGYSVIPLSNNHYAKDVLNLLEYLAVSRANEDITSLDMQIGPLSPTFHAYGFRDRVVPVAIVGVNNTAAISAIESWNGFFSTHGRLVSITSNQHNQIRAMNLSGYPFLGSYRTLAYDTSRRVHRATQFEIRLCNVRMNVQNNTTFLQGIIAHEIGHAFGIWDLNIQNSIMNPSLVSSTFFRPTQTDANIARDAWAVQ